MSKDIPEPAQEGVVEVTYETLGDLVQRFHDHTQAIPAHHIQTTEGIQREQGRRIVGVESAVIALTERVAELERDNQRLRGTASVESQRVDRLQRGMSRMQREMRQMRRFRFYDRVRVGRLESKMPNTQSRESMTHEEVEELIARRVAEEMEAREVTRNLEALNENEEEQEGENGGNENGGNERNRNGDNGGNGNRGNGNEGNGNHGMNYGGFMPMARECTFQDFLKCKPHTFSGTEGVVELTRWLKKYSKRTKSKQNRTKTGSVVMAILVISISSDSSEDSTGTPVGRVILFDDDTADSDTPDTPPSSTHDTPFTEITASTQRSHVILEGAAEVTYETLGDLVQMFHYHTQAIPVHLIALTERVAELERDNQRLRGTASVETQRVDRLQRDMSRMQREMRQMRRFRFYDRNSALTWWNSYKRTIGVDTAYPMKWDGLMKLMTEVYCPRNENVARAYAARNNKRKGYVGSLPYCSKCKLHYEGLCTIRCGNCKKFGHQTRDYRKDCPKLRKQNRGNQTRNKTGNKTGGNEVTARAYAIGGG
nr:reverse transcriptase domain-containing protein [Tanacetum cinerariifolium]